MDTRSYKNEIEYYWPFIKPLTLSSSADTVSKRRNLEFSRSFFGMCSQQALLLTVHTRVLWPAQHSSIYEVVKSLSLARSWWPHDLILDDSGVASERDNQMDQILPVWLFDFHLHPPKGVCTFTCRVDPVDICLFLRSLFNCFSFICSYALPLNRLPAPRWYVHLR